MIVDFAALPRLDGACRIGIVMPAKNEADVVEHALAAFAAQRDTSGTALDPRSYEILVFCNDCDDGTAAVARRFARRRPDLAVHVVEAAFAAESAHVGTARRAALDLAASRFTSAERTAGTIASVDADTIVDPTWVASMLAEIAHADAVAGHVLVAGDERDRMLAPLRLLYDRECEYRRMLGVVEARYDPLPYDVGPRHDSFVGASFAVTVAAYAASGGLPPLPRLEDLAFAQALQRIDARIRHSYAVRAHTSARQTSRVAGGFGSFVAELATKSGPRSTFAVRAARAAVGERASAGSPAERVVRPSRCGCRCDRRGGRTRRVRPPRARRRRRARGDVRCVLARYRTAHAPIRVSRRTGGSRDRGAASDARREQRASAHAREDGIGRRLTQIHRQIAYESRER